VVKINNKTAVAFGIFFAIISIIRIFSTGLDIFYIFWFIASIYIILGGIFEPNRGILFILLGFSMLIVGFIWIITQNLALSHPDVVFIIIIPIISLVVGIGLLIGIIPEKWMVME
jgi:hypothetical protein